MKSLTAIRKIANPEKRAKAAADLIHEADERAEDARQRRDLAALVMIEPFVRAVAVANEMQSAAKDAYYGYWTVGDQRFSADAPVSAERESNETGDPMVWHEPTIGDDEYQQRLAAARERRAADLERYNVTIYPAEVYTLIGVARNLFVRMMGRMPENLPEMDDPEAVAKAAAKDVRKYRQIAKDAVPVRDEGVEAMFYGNGTELRTNAYVARLTDLTTARVAQLRKGVR